jgi:hypothetical protein
LWSYWPFSRQAKSILQSQIRVVYTQKPCVLFAIAQCVGDGFGDGQGRTSARLDRGSKTLIVEEKLQNEMRRFDEEFTALDGAALRHCLRQTDLDGA